MITFVAEGESSDIGNVVMMVKRGRKLKENTAAVHWSRQGMSQAIKFRVIHIFVDLTTIMGVGPEGKAAKQINLTLILSKTYIQNVRLSIFFKYPCI